MAKTSLGLDENIESLLCYLMGFITGIVFILLEKDNKAVKFHAWQSTVTFGAIFVLSIVLGFIPIIGWLAGMVLWVVSLVLWIVLMVKAYKGEMFKVPIAADVAAKQAK